MASKYIQKFPVPEGFPEILHDLAKEILRNQPEDIIDFSAQYFKCLQEGIVLDYQKKGKNIPCDFRATVPQTSTKEQHNAGRKQISRQDDEDHAAAVKRTQNINDAAKVHFTETKNEHKPPEEAKIIKKLEIPSNDNLIQELTNSREEQSMEVEPHQKSNEQVNPPEEEEEESPDYTEKGRPQLKRISVDFIGHVMGKINIDPSSFNVIV
jgi:Rps23 Pro-64 3,4-dihydroxylase Tpa1-like proline 4-hydroxylase